MAIEDRKCIKCGGNIPVTKYKNAKYCSDKCRNAYITYKWAVKNKIKNPGVGSGGANAKGEHDSSYKNGFGIFVKVAFDNYPALCNRCESVRNLCVHHRNEDRKDNKISNLEILCKSCHQKHHAIRDKQTGRYISKS